MDCSNDANSVSSLSHATDDWCNVPSGGAIETKTRTASSDSLRNLWSQLPDKQLNSGDLRKYIIDNIVRRDIFRETSETFEVGGIKKALFFYKDIDSDLKRIYIALANTIEVENSHSITAIASGEQSIDIVLEKIKNDFSHNEKLSSARILMPLQQLGRKHWVLMDIKIEKTTDENALNTTAVYYDSKNRFLGELTNMCFKKDISVIKNAVKTYFDAEQVISIYSGSQFFLDTEHCGHYTLKMLEERLVEKERMNELKKKLKK
ncbi:MAG: hypothetical protein ACX93T_02155 [Bacteroidota bacterium]